MTCQLIPNTDPNFAVFVAASWNSDPYKSDTYLASANSPWVCSMSGAQQGSDPRNTAGYCLNVTDPTAGIAVACIKPDSSGGRRAYCFAVNTGADFQQKALQACQQWQT
jgi:hypothetical protein